MIKNQTLVSVFMITYNHENYIRDAIEGILFQKCDFHFDIVIGEDCSTDNTREILLKYQSKYPGKFKLLLHNNNIGAVKNQITTLEACHGKYIAICEGDDYWTDPYKLQKQVDLLEANNQLSGCFHNSEERFSDDYSKSSFLYLNLPSSREITLNDVCFENLIPTASIVFRNIRQDELTSSLFRMIPIGDWPLHLLNLRFGNYFYLPNVMSVHRLHSQSTWAMKSQNSNVTKVILAYDLLINSGWFSNEVVILLKKGKDNLLKNHFVHDYTFFQRVKSMILKKIILFLQKYI